MQASNTPRLETKRLIVRKFTIDDIQALYRIFSDREMNAFLPWYPVTSLQEAEKLYRVNYAQQYQQRRAYQYAICHKSDDIPIGYVHLSDTESRDLGFGLIPPFWGQGIVTEACMAVIAQAKEDNVPYITATHDVNNPRSGEVMKRLGMTYRYSYQEAWQPKNLLVVFRMYQLNLDQDKERTYMEYWNRYPVHFIEEGV